MLLAPRQHLRDDARTRLIEWIVAGRLSPGRSVGEEAIAAELGISRTPLREALIALERDGFVEAQHSRGFVVNPLSRSEVREIYPVLWGLEVVAVELGAAAGELDLTELRRLNRKFLDANTARDRLDLDTAWHRALISTSHNLRLIALVERARNAVKRYERAYMSARGLQAKSAREHTGIIHALSQGKVGAATQRVKHHWREGQERVLQLIASRGD